MNYTHLYVASKESIHVFSLKNMQQIAKIKAPYHLMRIELGPNEFNFNTIHQQQ